MSKSKSNKLNIGLLQRFDADQHPIAIADFEMWLRSVKESGATHIELEGKIFNSELLEIQMQAVQIEQKARKKDYPVGTE